MKLADLCITRPVLATVVNIIVVLLGLVAADSLSTREYPNIDVPTVTVTTNFSGASAEIIETQVTKVIEDQLSGIEGIDYITSISRAESSQITVTFKLERDADAAASDVRDRVGRAREFLPEEVNEPIIAKVEADAEPIIYLAFSSDRHSELEVTDVADRLVQDRLQSLPGVASAPIYGERRYAMRVWIDAQRLAAYQMTTQDVEVALRAQNVEIPAGRIEGAMREFTVLSETDVNSVEQFQQIVLKDAGGYFVRLGDVARVEVGPASERLVARFNGESAVALGIIKQSTANPLDVSIAVQESLPAIRALLPEGMKVDIAYDSTVFITASIDSVEETILEAVVLVVLVIFFFLRSVRAVFVPLVTIPISLIGACALMVLFGFSINVLTLLAFVVAIGLVVDDAIVVLENIYRHIEQGLSPMAAALKGSREIGFAVVAMTITLASVFVPVAFTSGKTGKLFIEFALTLSAAVLISGFVALTLSPMMCSRLLKGHQHHGFVWRLTERFFQGLNRGYSASLHFVFSIRPLVVVVAIAIAAANYFLFTGLRSELSPQEDRGYFIVFAIGPEGATVDYMDKYVHGIEGIAASVEDAKQYFSIIGFPVISNALAFVVMKDWEERERPTSAAAESVGGPLFGGLPGILAFPINPQSLGQGGFSQPIEVVVQTSASYEELDALVGLLYARAGELKSVVNLDVDLRLNKPELRVSVNRDKLAAVGVDVDTIGRTLETLLGGRDVTRFKRDGEQYDVIVQLAPDSRRVPTDLSQLYVRSNKGEMIQLSNLVTLTETVAPREINHFNKLRAVTITGGVAPGATQGQGLAELTNLIRSIGGPAVQIDYGGTAREFFESGASLYVAFVLALLFVYLVMAAQFESFVDPFIIMLSVPLAMVGALLALTLSGGTLNIYSQIGLISLVGLIAKNGILVVEFANQLQDEGRSVRDAVLEASVLRLRPVLMTAGAMVLGALPLALATGAGAESREQIGWVLVGGVSLGTLFTLYIVPVVYSLIARKRNLVKIADLEDEIALGGEVSSNPTAP